MKRVREQERERPEKKRRLNLRWIIVLAVGVYAMVTVISQQNSISAQLQKQDKLLQRQKDLQNQIEFLTNEKDFIGTETFVERAAREKLGWIKEGEIIFKEDGPGQSGDAGNGNQNDGE